MPSRHRSDPGLNSGRPKYPGTFLLAFREAVARLNWQISRWLGHAVACLDTEGQEHLVGLENLYRRARREDRAAWPELISTFLTSVDFKQFENPPEDLASVADRLMVRLGSPMSGRSEALPIWAQPLAGTGFGINLVVDYPQSMFYVTEKMVADSGRPGDEWVQRALANLAAQTPAECFQVVHEESGLRLCAVGDAYDSSRALLLDALLPETRADGFFVALPGRDELLVLPVTAAALNHVPLLQHLAEKNFKIAPYAISDQVFWIQEGVWHPFPIALHEDRIIVQPPPEFLAVLKRLAPETAITEEDEAGETDEIDESDESEDQP
jgi:hypothetical protein